MEDLIKEALKSLWKAGADLPKKAILVPSLKFGYIDITCTQKPVFNKNYKALKNLRRIFGIGVLYQYSVPFGEPKKPTGLTLEQMAEPVAMVADSDTTSFVILFMIAGVIPIPIGNVQSALPQRSGEYQNYRWLRSGQ